jgi:hypothetical protein
MGPSREGPIGFSRRLGMVACGRPGVDGQGDQPVDLTTPSIHEIGENDFMARAGDGYPAFSSRMPTQDSMDQVAADYIGANTPISPSIQGRITGIEGGGPVVNTGLVTLP